MTTQVTQPVPDVESLMAQILLTQEETASVLRVPLDTIKNLHRTGRLNGVLVGKHLRFLPAAIRAFAEGLNGDDS